MLTRLKKLWKCAQRGEDGRFVERVEDNFFSEELWTEVEEDLDTFEDDSDERYICSEETYTFLIRDVVYKRLGAQYGVKRGCGTSLSTQCRKRKKVDGLAAAARGTPCITQYFEVAHAVEEVGTDNEDEEVLDVIVVDDALTIEEAIEKLKMEEANVTRNAQVEMKKEMLAFETIMAWLYCDILKLGWNVTVKWKRLSLLLRCCTEKLIVDLAKVHVYEVGVNFI